MSSFGPKRKARIIQPLDGDDTDLKVSSDTGEEEQSDRESQPTTTYASLSSPPLLIIGPSKSEQADALPAEPAPPGRIKFRRTKPAKSSALRKSFNPNEEDDGQERSASAPAATARDGDEDDVSSAPVVVRPALGRSGSSRLKKRASSSRLSFGTSGPTADEEGVSTTPSVVTKPSTPKKPLGQRLLEKNALRRTSSLQNLAGNLPVRFGSEEERPKYSKEYLEELQSSTPNTPQNLASLQIHDDEDDMELDQSELEGALVVQSTDIAAPPAPAPPAAAHILTEAEIRERKERRARLAKEAEFISLEGGSDDEETGRGQGGRMTVHFPSKKKESRLIAEDEDLGEGYDEFVSDGGLALGKKAEREAAKRHRQEMAELIQAAEEGSEGETDDSEAERRAAYEAAQRRAGMDGLHRPHDPDGMDMDGAMMGPDAIPRMKPLPKLSEVLQRMRDIVQGLEDQVTRKRARIEDLEKEKEEILTREKEVQEILNQAGAKYQALVASTGGQAGDVEKMVSGQSPLRPLPPGMAGDFQPTERGLESFGATPTRRDDVEMT
ncbi:nineteen complex-related protein 2-domain-containing protein [Achaetomium macrosporum]|uniref:Nineteen complex-related protein 2-domain-containing protein n=1 Tax=Achaetomium macrosporum TaxID=79813 RepID=A0AAN7C1Q7_9PEZI|nr:nineteen complex-related protein 2-domain-containing protein [Achaetomium macrosporum]